MNRVLEKKEYLVRLDVVVLNQFEHVVIVVLDLEIFVDMVVLH